MSSGKQLQIVDLSGHVMGMCGVVTPDDVFFIGDSLYTFDELSDLVLTHLHDGGTSAEDQIVSFPRHVRSASGPRYAICLECNANGENGGTFANNSHTSTNDDADAYGDVHSDGDDCANRYAHANTPADIE